MQRTIIIALGILAALLTAAGCSKEPTPPVTQAQTKTQTPAPAQASQVQPQPFEPGKRHLPEIAFRSRLEDQSQPVSPTAVSGASGEALITRIENWKTTYPDLFAKYPELEKLIKSFQAEEIVPLLLKDLLQPGALEIMIASLSGNENEVSLGTDILDAIKNNNNSKETEKILIGLLSHPEGKVRNAAVGMLSYLLNYKLIPEITDLLSDPDRQVRETVAYILGASQDKQVIPKLVKSATDLAGEVSAAALYSLANLEDKLTLRLELIKFLSNPDSAMRNGAVKAIGHIRIREAKADLLTMLADPDAGVCCNAIWALGELHVQEERLKDNAISLNYNGSLSPEALAGIAQLLSHSDSRVRCQAIRTLALWHARSVAPQIIGLLSDADAQVRAEAVDAVIKFDDATAAPDLIKLLVIWGHIRIKYFFLTKMQIKSAPAISYNRIKRINRINQFNPVVKVLIR